MARNPGSGRKPRAGTAANLQLPIRFTPAERDRIDAVCGPNRSEWMRGWILAGLARCEDLGIQSPRLTPTVEPGYDRDSPRG